MAGVTTGIGTDIIEVYYKKQREKLQQQELLAMSPTEAMERVVTKQHYGRNYSCHKTKPQGKKLQWVRKENT